MRAREHSASEEPMAIFGISDLHLSFSTDKPMHIFGEHWRGHADKMAACAVLIREPLIQTQTTRAGSTPKSPA